MFVFVETMMHRSWIFLSVRILLANSLCTAQPLTPGQRESLCMELRENFFVPDPLPLSNPLTYRRFEPALGVEAEAVTYATQLGTRVPATVYIPKPIPKAAARPVNNRKEFRNFTQVL